MKRKAIKNTKLTYKHLRKSTGNVAHSNKNVVIYIKLNRYIREQMFTSNNGDRSNMQNYIVILTDGRSDNRDATWRETQAARQAGIHIISGMSP